jgi:hypothetical protein
MAVWQKSQANIQLFGGLGDEVLVFAAGGRGDMANAGGCR